MSAPRIAFLRGFRQSLPFFLVLMPFGLLFGVLGAEAGLTLTEVMTFSLTVFAGASQFAALQMMQDHAPLWAVLATAMAVNLRLLMYSVALTPHLGAAPIGTRALIAYFLVDQSFTMASAEYARNPQLTLAEKTAYFFGVITPMMAMWTASNLAGAQMGQAIPPEWALDFAIPITFLALLSPLLRSLADWVAASLSTLGALVLAGLPFGTGLLIAAALAMTAGALVEWQQERRNAP